MQYQTNYPYATTSQQYGAISHPREEQRRRQQEYSQALAQQVAQREQQKRHERDARNNTTSQNQPTIEHTRHAEPTERGILDGLGQNSYQSSRANYGRGQPQLHQRLPGGPESVNYPQNTGFPPAGVSYSGQSLQQPSANFPPAYNQPPVNNQQSLRGFVNSVGLNQPQSVLQQSWQQQPLQDPSGLRPNPGWPPPNSLSQARTSQFWPGQTIAEQDAPPSAFGGYASPQRAAHPNSQSNFPASELNHNGGRRQRTDIHEGGWGDSEEAEKYRRKLLQQQEMQLALERQIQEKRQQKLEAKRRQEEEDRREMERFEEDKRRQRAEEERLQEEKRRKAQIEQQKADQAAAAVDAANQRAKLQQQQNLHAQISQAHIQHAQQAQPFQQFPPQPQLQQPERFGNAPSPSKLKNPFTNSRAHLFEDPPPLHQSPQRGQMISNDHFGHSNQDLSPMRIGPQGFGQAFPQRTTAVGRSLDSTELRRQYDDMREELLRQKQLVDQLRQAQVQIQHQQQQLSPMRAKSGSIPTLMDLEELRNELRGELAYREQIHRQELESLKREQLHERTPVHSPHRYPGVNNSVDLLNRSDNRVQHHSATLNNQEVPSTRAQPAFESRQSRQSPVKPVQHSQNIERLPRLPEKPLDASLVSLRGESKFVYFDGRVAEPGKARDVVAAESTIMDHGSDVLDDQSESVELETTKVRKSLLRSPTKEHFVKKCATTMPSPKPARRRVDFKNDRVDESHDFVVASVSFSPLHKQNQNLLSSPRAAASSHRYSQIPSVLSSRSPLKNSGKWRLESMGTNDTSDSDDELDASLDGEQLETLFQRNVRRHEILLGFQIKVQAQVHDSNQHDGGGTPHAKLALAELRQQLEHNRLASSRAQRRRLSTTSTDSNDSTLRQQTAEDETALVASSQWMPSTLLPIEGNARSRNK